MPSKSAISLERGPTQAMLHSVYDQPDSDAVQAQFERLLDYVDDKLPDVHVTCPHG